MHNGNASYRHAHNDLWALQTLPLIPQHALETQEVKLQTAQILHRSLSYFVRSNSAICSCLWLGICEVLKFLSSCFGSWLLTAVICVLHFT